MSKNFGDAKDAQMKINSNNYYDPNYVQLYKNISENPRHFGKDVRDFSSILSNLCWR